VTNSEAAKIVRTLLCRGLTNQQAEQIVNAMVPTTVPAGGAVFREEERAKGLFVLLEGTVEVVKEDGGTAVVIASVEAPSVLGEMSLITDRPHSATVRPQQLRVPPADARAIRSTPAGRERRRLQGRRHAGRRDRLAPEPDGREVRRALAPRRIPAAGRGARDVQAEAVQ
jgi:hypothetical protein